MEQQKAKLIFKFTFLLFLFFTSCNDKCSDIICENSGVCMEGICDCQLGYIGDNCELFDTNNIQALLDSGRTPFYLYQNGIELNQLLGKIYLNGYIFLLDTINGSGMVASLSDYETRIDWGCDGLDIANLENAVFDSNMGFTGKNLQIGEGLNNTNAILDYGCLSSINSSNETAAKVCRDLGVEWFLPSLFELELMRTNLNGIGNFKSDTLVSTNDAYCSSSEIDENYIILIRMSEGKSYFNAKWIPHFVRAARAF